MDALLDRIRGSLVGGAAGDALGYPVEFMDAKDIRQHYGGRGITRPVIDSFAGKALFSDDTQMTLFTANGILNAKRLGIPATASICNAYIEWYLTQVGRKSERYRDCWIADFPEMNASRAPGITCMSALESLMAMKTPCNNSKGCGGVMRIAPIPLHAAANGRMSIEDADRLAGDAAELTHKHPLGFIPAALMAHVIYRLATEKKPSRDSMEAHVREGMEMMGKLYAQHDNDVRCMAELAKHAIALSHYDSTDLENIEQLGEGWTGEEALAIALYCALKHFDSFEDALIAAVNHGGDSDSTGAITGNILGAAIGYEAIPRYFKDDLELHDVILQMADDLHRGEITTNN